MKNRSEWIFEKYLYEIIQRQTITKFNEIFQEVFSDSCKLKPNDDTTLMYTFTKLEIMIYNHVDKFLDEMFINTLISPINKNEGDLTMVYRSLIDYFFEDINLRDYINIIVGDEYWDKSKELQALGILDENDDFINGDVAQCNAPFTSTTGIVG